jgi:UDP-2,3-diacylglucosamine hydrolase
MTSRLMPHDGSSSSARAASSVEPIGLLACAGRYPIVIAEKAREIGTPVIGVGVASMADPALATICDRYYPMRRLSLSFIAKKFVSNGVKRWTMAGKFHKHLLFQPWSWFQFLPDWRMLRFWYSRSRSDNKDDSLLMGLIHEFRKDGLECVSALDLCPELLVRQGVLTQRSPTASEDQDIRFGWELAKRMGDLDVGQSVMVRDRAVLAVEAIEGTDHAILRAGQLCQRNPFVVVKVAKPKQDMRFDVPTVGVTTIERMREAGARVLAVEAGKTILLDEANTILLANRYGITIVAMNDPT